MNDATADELETDRIVRRARAAVVAGSLVAVTVVLLATRGRFSTNDDVFIRSIASGRFGGHPDAHLVYVNVVIGWPLTLLYHVSSAVPWYGLALALTPALGIGAVGWTLVGSPVGRRPLAVVPLVSALAVVVSLQTFTACAIVAAACGVAVHRIGLERQSSARSDALAIALIALGAAWRIEGAVLAVLLAEIVVVIGSRAAVSVRHLRFAVLTVLACVALHAIDALSYGTSDAWDTYRAFDDVRGQLSTTPRLDASPALEAGRIAAGWSENDLAMFTDWSYSDPSTFTTASVREIVRATGGETGGRTLAEAFADDVWNPYRHWVAVVAIGGVSVAWPRRRGVAAMAVACIAWMALGSYLALHQRFPERVALPSAMAIPILGAACAGLREDVRRGRSKLLALGIVPLLVIAVGQVIERSDRAAADAVRLAERRRAMATWPDPTVFVVVGSAADLEGVSSLDERSPLPTRSLVLSWTTFSPSYTRQLARLGLGPFPLRDAAGRSDVVLVVPASIGAAFAAEVNVAMAERGDPDLTVEVRSTGSDLAFVSG